MERVILRHLAGSRANQVDEFPLSDWKELTLGRDPASAIQYDPEKDDLVSRQHARIGQDPGDPSQFTITDLGSRNGTFLNKQRISGTARLTPGDVVQLGAGGPEFQFDQEPPPERQVRATRIGSEAGAGSPASRPTPETRVGAASPSSAGAAASAPPATGASPPIGRNTVERMVSQARSDTRRQMLMGIGILVPVAVVVAGLLFYQNTTVRREAEKKAAEAKRIAEQNKTDLKTAQESAPQPVSAIASANTDAVVFIETSWKLVFTRTGGQVYQQYIANQLNGRPIIQNGEPTVPAYVNIEGSTEPLLTLNDGRGTNKPIGTTHTGSGFIVTPEGHILTNRHVAWTWETAYTQLTPGVLVEFIPRGMRIAGTVEQPPRDWVPTKAKFLGGKPIIGKTVDGRRDYLEVTLPNTRRRINAEPVQPSDRHDVAMLKINIPGSLRAVQLSDAVPKQGAIITVMGYPGQDPQRIIATRSRDPFNRSAELKVIPDPSVNPGNVTRLLRDRDAAAGDKDPIFSQFGDSYQLNVASAGPGNSGGPVFDDHGKVIGIYYAGSSRISFAVPIKYGLELMGTSSESG